MTSDVVTLGRLLPTTNKIHENQLIMSIEGGCCTIKASSYKDPPKILIENKIDVLCDLGVGGQRGRVYNANGILGALSATDYKQPPSVIIRENDE